MNGRLVLFLAVASALAGASCGKAPASEEPASASGTQGHGTIRGHVRLMGTPPPNPSIRLRADPMCEQANGGKPAFRETVIAAADGSLANVFVTLQGSFPETPAPTQPIDIDQRACSYLPHVIGAQVGQVVRVRNSDPGLHNVHGTSDGHDAFNVGQPMAGMVSEFRMKEPGIIRLQCDVHGWMLAFVGVASHPYFAVTGADGTFEIRDVPAGTYPIQTWHELYGPLTSTVSVAAGGAADVAFVYSGDEKPAATLKN